MGGMGVEERRKKMPLAPHWADGCFATRAARRALHASFPERFDRYMVVVFVLLSVGFIVYQVAQAASRLSRADSEPTILASSRAVEALYPVVALCTEFTSPNGALYVTLNGDVPNDGEEGDPLYQRPFFQFSFDENLNRVVGDGQTYSAASFFKKLFEQQLASLRPSEDPAVVLERWGYEDVTADRFEDSGIEAGSVMRYHRCAAFNADRAFKLREPEAAFLSFTVITASSLGRNGSTPLFEFQVPLKMYAVHGRPGSRADLATGAHSFAMSRGGVYQTSLEAHEYTFVNGSARHTFDTTGAYGGKTSETDADQVAALFGVDTSQYKLEVASVTVRARGFRVQVTREVPSYSLSQFASDVGGSLGVLTALYAFVFPTIVSLPHQVRGAGQCRGAGAAAAAGT